MIGLIVTGHANFGSGLTTSLELICGKPTQYKYVDFLSEYSVEDLESELKKAIVSLSDCEGILICSDLIGGSPFKSSVILSTGHENIRVVAGTNLGMLVEVNMSRQFVENIDDLANQAVDTGRASVMKYVFEMVEEEEYEDGI